MISYEIALGLSIIALVMMTGTMSLAQITQQQAGINWNVFHQPLTFLIFLVCAFAECNRTPFDLAECESELINGHHTEFSSMKMGFYMFSEYVAMFFSSLFMSVLFFGGYNYPADGMGCRECRRKHCQSVSGSGTDCQSSLLYLLLYVDSMDNTTFPL